MSTFGVLVNTNTIATLAGSGNRFYFVGGDFPGGTITGLQAYAKDRANNSAFNDFDMAIYSGGSGSGPSGASLLWESKRYAAVALGTPVDWRSIVDAGNAAPNVAASAGWIWVMLRTNDGVDLSQVADSSDEGDFQAFGNTWTYVGTGDSPGESWPVTFAANGSSNTEVIKVYLEYTVATAALSGALLGRTSGVLLKM